MTWQKFCLSKLLILFGLPKASPVSKWRRDTSIFSTYMVSSAVHRLGIHNQEDCGVFLRIVPIFLIPPAKWKKVLHLYPWKFMSSDLEVLPPEFITNIVLLVLHCSKGWEEKVSLSVQNAICTEIPRPSKLKMIALSYTLCSKVCLQ
jgi:hypothetical protein